MIKFPESKSKRKSDKTECSLKAAVNAGMVALGQRYIIEGNPVTCVDIDGNKYIFQWMKSSNVPLIKKFHPFSNKFMKLVKLMIRKFYQLA